MNYKECSPARVARYKGKRPPKCNHGAGCDLCWDKYLNPQRTQMVPKRNVLEMG